MKVVFASLALVLVACSFGQTSAQKCQGVSNYIAKSFNALQNTLSTSYHDSLNFKTLFADSFSRDFALYVIQEGKIYTYSKGTCNYYYNADLAMTPAEIGSKMQIQWQIDNFWGSQSYAYTVPNGQVTIRGVIDDEQCVEAFTFIAVRGYPITSAFHTEYRINNVDYEIEKNIEDAEAIISASTCSPSIF